MFPVVLFIVLIIVGLWMEELTWKAAGLFAIVWLIGFFAANLFDMSAPVLMVITVLLDVVLVLIIFRGDIRIR